MQSPLDRLDQATPALMMHQASIVAGAESAERIARALEEAADPPAAVGLFERGDGRFEVFAHYAAQPSREHLLTLIEDAAGGARLGQLKIEEIAPGDWVTLSQGQRGPVSAGRFLVHGSHDRQRAPSHRFVVEIDAGRAFGTAHHASTRGCLLALDALLKRRRPHSIVDLGTGTGILAIAAANALKRKVLASDSDPVAVTIAGENARNNCAGSQVHVVRADGFAHPLLRWLKADLVLANLLERVLYDLAPALAKRVAPGGRAILSGLTETQARSIEARTRAHGFVMEKRIVLDGWTTLVITRRSAKRMRD
ncbi:MAG TPA: 50S ribosomal protein L11 methyltransferase [Methyloceanibacter sp.]|jgi:ribosomal protein L11 methyltransferase|nr:50S ribosomal protein L11 methyltransferase [Methyloceanibacter sp.]